MIAPFGNYYDQIDDKPVPKKANFCAASDGEKAKKRAKDLIWEKQLAKEIENSIGMSIDGTNRP